MKRPTWLVFLTLAAALAPAACSLRRARSEPLPPEATRALATARTLQRTRPGSDGVESWRPAARLAAQEAARAAPGWLAPERVLDDLARERLLGHAALAQRLAALDDGATAGELYLVGRLEGRAGSAVLERAAALDPNLAWAQHGLAWTRYVDGQTKAALRAGARAVELARGSHELGFFAGAEARYLLELERADEAVEKLTRVLAEREIEEPERTELEAWLARAELEASEPAAHERGFWRAVALLEEGRLASDEYERLGDALIGRSAGGGGSADEELGVPDALAVLESALAGAGAGNTSARARLCARVLVQRGARALGATLYAQSASVPDAFTRARDLERGRAAQALERWRAALPARLLEEDGLPREPALRALVLAARSCSDAAGARAFGERLLEAGWFAEAESWSDALLELDESAALDLHARAAAGTALVAGIRGLLERVDGARAAGLPAPDAAAVPEARPIGELDDLLRALQPFFERYRGAPLALDLVQSPRLVQGGLAVVVHPGPRFSKLDEREGRGTAGAPVGGLAAELAHIGRFGIFGQAPGGGGPDGTLLRKLGSEWKSGTHLGVAYAGLVVWCEGADVPSRPGRHGSAVSGAALHEGYWIDLEGVRRDFERLRALEREFLEHDPASPSGDLEAALAAQGPLAPRSAGSAENARWMAPLGEGERIELTVLRERAAAGQPAGARITFDELLDLTALHEEGHLTDRTRFLPLSARWTRALGFALRYGFVPRSIAQALEYRAQLVALCEAAEPRLALAECLGTGDAENNVLPHGDAYQELVSDLLQRASVELDTLPALDGSHYLVYQLHRLSGAEVRRLALEVAQRNGMIEE